MSLRLPNDAAKRLRALAAAEDRPVGAYLRRLVLAALAALDEKPPPSAKARRLEGGADVRQ